MTFFATLAGRILLFGLLVGILIFGIDQCSNARQASREANLSRGQGQAASQSGADAVGTVGAVAGREAVGNDLTRTNEQEIRSAPGADASVGAVGNVGLAALCRRAAYRDDPRCVGVFPSAGKNL